MDLHEFQQNDQNDGPTNKIKNTNSEPRTVHLFSISHGNIVTSHPIGQTTQQ
jgi:hypothetical protein